MKNVLIILLIIVMSLDFGAAVSQKGYDVKTCADRNLVYSSAFQTLKVFNTYAVSGVVPSGAKNTITINHNLGYFAPFIIVFNGSSRYGTGTSYLFSDSVGSGLDAKNTINSLTIDIYLNFDQNYDDPSKGSVPGNTVYFTVYMFLNDFTTIAHSEKNTGTSSGSSSTDYGIRISKPGFDVKTCADIDCILSSSFFNQIIDQIGVYTATSDGYNKVISITDQGFIPSLFTYFLDYGASAIYYAPVTVKSNQLIAWQMFNGDKAYYIIFKNKLN